MARIRSLGKSTASARPHPTEVDCTWQVVGSGDDTLLQLSTYGSPDRASEPKVSQTIQLDRVVATDLLAILRTTFPD